MADRLTDLGEAFQRLGEVLLSGNPADTRQLGAILEHSGRALQGEAGRIAERIADLEDRVEVLESTARGARKARFTSWS